jgi:hypothetical protein
MHHEDHQRHPIGLWTLWLLLGQMFWQLTMAWFKSAGSIKGMSGPVRVSAPRAGITYVSAIHGESHIMLTSMALRSSSQETESRLAKNWVSSAVRETLSPVARTYTSVSRLDLD